jgi:hypothetical protein
MFLYKYYLLICSHKLAYIRTFIMTDKPADLAAAATVVHEPNNGLHYAQRGSVVDKSSPLGDPIAGYNDDRMQARSLLTADEEKKLMRRVDWRLMVSAFGSLTIQSLNLM